MLLEGSQARTRDSMLISSWSGRWACPRSSISPAPSLDDLHKLHRRWVFRILRIVIESTPRLAPVQTRQHHALQQWWRCEALLAEFIKHDLGDVIGCIQANKVTESERTHRITQAQLHRSVNVYNR